MPRGDTIARYENYDMHSVARPQRRNNESLASLSKTKDTVETSKEKSDRMTPLKIDSSERGASKDRMVFIGRAGRFVFMAVCMPPYFVLYGMPKFLIVNVLPQLMNMAKSIGNYSANVLNNVKVWFVHNLINPFRDAFGKINFAIKRLQKGIAGFFLQLKNVIAKPFTFVISKFKQVLSETNKKINSVKNAFFKRLTNLLKTTKEIIGKSKMLPENAIKSIKAPFIKTREMVANLGTFFTNLAKSFQDSANRLSRKISEINKTLAKAASSAGESVKQKAQQIAALPALVTVPVVNFFITARNVIGEWGKFSLKRVTKSGKSALQKGAKRIKSAWDGTKKFFGNLPRRAKERAANFKKWLTGPVVEYIHEEIPFLVDAYHFIKRVIQRIRAIIDLIISTLAKVYKKCSNVVKQAYIKVRTTFQKAFLILKKYSFAILNALKRRIAYNIAKFLMQIFRKSISLFKGSLRAFAELFRELHQEVRSWIA